MIPMLAVAGGTSLLNGLFNKQKAPPRIDYTPVDPQAEQRRAIDGNLGAEATIEQLLTRANRYTQGQANSLMEMAIPGYGKISQKFLGLAGDKIDNRYSLPKEVQDNLGRIAAERGISTGVRGQAGDFSLLRDLGVNMLEYGDRQVSQAQSLLSTVAGLAPRVSPISPISFYVTPQQQMSVAGSNNATRQGVDQSHANATTAADNWNRNNMWESLSSSLILGAGAFGKPAPKT